MRLTDIKPNPNNPRIVKDNKFKKLVKSIKEFPKMMELRPMVIDSEGIVLGGNMRLKALKELNYKEIPNSWVKRAETLTEEEKERFIIADNVGFGAWDWDELANNWDEEKLIDWGLDIPDFEPEILEAVEDDYQEPEQMQVDVVLGDLIEFVCDDGRVHRLLCGDSTCSDSVGRLMDGKKADMVFTDPPYGVSFVGPKGTMYDSRKKKKPKFEIDAYKEIENDNLRGQDITNLFNQSISNAYIFTVDNCAFYIFFAINRSAETIAGLESISITVRNWLIWDKGNVGFHALGAQYKPNYEAFLYCHKDKKSPNWDGGTHQQTIWRHSLEYLKLHPTAKPIALITQALNNHKAKTILDLFLGSGSTMVAAHQLNRTCYGIELDEKYVQVIIDRMQKLDPTIKVKLNGKAYKKEGAEVPF